MIVINPFRPATKSTVEKLFGIKRYNLNKIRISCVVSRCDFNPLVLYFEGEENTPELILRFVEGREIVPK
jgi:hypothetical protein